MEVDNWMKKINMDVIPPADGFVDNQTDIRILAIICSIMKQLPICFNDTNLLYFRRNLTLSLYEDSRIL